MNVEKGRLSSRMRIPGNTWQIVWEAAKPVPARRQKRLFDDTKEAEKVMHFFESQTIGQIVKLTLAALFHTSIITVKVSIYRIQYFALAELFFYRFNKIKLNHLHKMCRKLCDRKTRLILSIFFLGAN